MAPKELLLIQFNWIGMIRELSVGVVAIVVVIDVEIRRASQDPTARRMSTSITTTMATTPTESSRIIPIQSS